MKLRHPHEVPGPHSVTPSPTPQPPRPIRFAVRATTAIVALLVLGLSFGAYSVGQAMSAHMGFHWRVAAGNLFFASLPALGLGLMGAMVARALGAITLHRGLARLESGRCVHCGYRAALERCSECGQIASQPPTQPPDLYVAGPPLLAATIACLLGAGVAEGLIRADEAAFRAEVTAGTLPANGNGLIFRERAWPNRDATLIYNPATCEFSATD